MKARFCLVITDDFVILYVGISIRGVIMGLLILDVMHCHADCPLTSDFQVETVRRIDTICLFNESFEISGRLIFLGKVLLFAPRVHGFSNEITFSLWFSLELIEVHDSRKDDDAVIDSKVKR